MEKEIGAVMRGEDNGPAGKPGALRLELLNTREWMKELEFLPPFLRDFHDQKDLFKAIDAYFKPSPELQNHTWVSNHIFTVDFFLWFCGIHGYTLQRSRKKGVAFENLNETLERYKAKWLASMPSPFNAPPAEGPAKSSEPEQSPQSPTEPREGVAD